MSLHAAKSVRVFGYVVDSDNRGVELANVYVEENTTIGTTTNQIGRASCRERVCRMV